LYIKVYIYLKKAIMDILNWLYLRKEQLIKTTVNNPTTDLLVLGAEVPLTKRGDGYQSYGMTVEDFTNQLDLDRLTAGTRELVLDKNGDLTLNTGDLTIQTDPLLGDDIFILATDRAEVRGGDKLLNANNTGGRVYLLAGTGSDSDGITDAGDGGSIRVYAGDAGTSVAGNQANGGEVTIRGGYTSVLLTAGGPVTIEGGSSVSNIEGIIYIGSSNTFTFDPNQRILVYPLAQLTDLGSPVVSAGARAMLIGSTVAAAGNFGAIVVDGGANIVPVFSDGTNWLIG
jgi:hypothetical protein